MARQHVKRVVAAIAVAATVSVAWAGQGPATGLASTATRVPAKVTVVFLKTGSHKPLRNLSVGIQQFGRGTTLDPQGPLISSSLNMRTDGHGQVFFAVRSPLSGSSIWITSGVGFEGPGATLELDRVLKTGVIVDCADRQEPEVYWIDAQGRRNVIESGKPLPRRWWQSGIKVKEDLKIRPQPGEVYIIGRPFTNWDWFLQELP